MDIGAISHGLRCDADGIWRAASASAVSYPDDGHQLLAAVEEASFWFRHRNRCIAAAVGAHPPSGAIFDIGGGNGFVSAGLRAAGFDAVLVEPGPQGASNARRRGLPNVVCATTESAGFAPATLPAIGLFDVVEHVEDDAGFIAGLRPLLVDGGRLYLSVPAYGWLWSHEDVEAGHFRRYSLTGLRAMIAAAGFRIDYAGYFFRPLPLPILLLRSLPDRLGLARGRGDARAVSRDHAVRRGPLVRALERLLEPEVRHIRAGREMAFGGSCLLVATKG